MHIIVVGCGDVGAQLALLLSIEGHDVVVIDKNPAAFERLGAAFNGVTISGHGFEAEILKNAGIDRCEAFAAVTEQDNTNMMVAEVAAKMYQVPKVVARLYNVERESTFQQLGLEYICATTMVAQSILEKLVTGHGHHFLVRGDMEMIEFVASAAVHQQTVKAIQIPNEFRICLVTRNGASFIPWRDSRLHDRDRLLAIVKAEAHAKIKKYIREV